MVPLDWEFLHAKAKQCREIAKTVRDPVIRSRLQTIAHDYDTLARDDRSKGRKPIVVEHDD